MTEKTIDQQSEIHHFRDGGEIVIAMTAIEIDGKGGPEVLVSRQTDVPEAGPGQVLIKVHAAGINRPDVLQRQGLYPPPEDASPVLGLEVAGEVLAFFKIGPGMTVLDLFSGGGYYAEILSGVVGEDGSVLEHLPYVNLGMAVDTERGLLVPVIRDADKKSLLELSLDLNRLADLARTKKLSLNDMQGGNFTISNLGNYGVEMFTPVINSSK